MKITIIRHEKVDMLWNKKYNSTTYDLACDEYDRRPIIFSTKEYFKADNTKAIYISELSRTHETACRIFEKTDFHKTAFLNEVPLKSFKDTDKMYPLWLWNFTGRLQWLLQSKRQVESKKATIIRAGKMIDLLEKQRQIWIWLLLQNSSIFSPYQIPFRNRRGQRKLRRGFLIHCPMK